MSVAVRASQAFAVSSSVLGVAGSVALTAGLRVRTASEQTD